MGEKCPPSYRNLNTIKSYSEQKYATVQWCQQNCENDEWLRQQVEELRYLSPPAVRKRFDISKYLDEKHSYSCRGTSNHQVIFDDREIDVRIFDFRDIENQVDKASTDAYGENYPQPASNSSTEIIQTNPDGTVIETPPTQLLRYCLPKTIDVNQAEANYVDFGTMLKSNKTDKEKINSYWYVAWDKDKTYYVRPDWLKNWKDSGIKSVCRAQTFKAEATGQLTSIDLALAWNGSKTSDCGSPLYVQIWNTYPTYVDKSTWDSDNHKMKYKYLDWNKDLTDEQRNGIYKDRQRYEAVDEVVKHTKGKKKGKPVQIAKKKDGKTVYVNKTKRVYKKKSDGPLVRKVEQVHKPGNNKPGSRNIDYPLAEAVYEEVGEPYPNISFDVPCIIEEGKYYAIVLFSPLSEWKHCPRWGGWGRNCRNDKAYKYGHAFLSKNNGTTWTIYGKDGAELDPSAKKKYVDYKKGKWTPQDFAFECHVETNKYKSTPTEENHYSDKEHYLYLKPIYSNPIKTVELSSECFGTEASQYGYFIIFEVSTDGEEWTEIKNQGSLNLETDENGNRPRVLLVRAKLYRDPDDKFKQDTPFIENIKVTLYTEPSKEMYARTSLYKPRTSPMLGANLWGRVFAPFSCEETVNCSVDIIQGNTSDTQIRVIDINSLDEVLYQALHNTEEIDDTIINDFTEKGINIVNIVNTKFGEERAKELTNNPESLEILKNYNIYIKPYISEDRLTYYLLSFGKYDNPSDLITTRAKESETVNGVTETVNWDDYEVCGIPIKDNVAYPILSLEGIPNASEQGSTGNTFSEVVDYTFDYENNILYFSRRVVEDLIEETLVLKYNKMFVSGLSKEEVGVRIDETTGLRSEGLILDYFKETVHITESHVTSRRIKLRVPPTDPIRSVHIYKYDLEEGLEPSELYEDYDFTLDINTNELVFSVNNTDGVSTVLDVGDTVEIVYTPNLEDESIGLGYYATRENTDKQCYIDNIYFEYKV